jgi:hypothetical protein
MKIRILPGDVIRASDEKGNVVDIQIKPFFWRALGLCHKDGGEVEYPSDAVCKNGCGVVDDGELLAKNLRVITRAPSN